MPWSFVLEQKLLGNSVSAWLIALGIVLAFVLAARVGRTHLGARLKRWAARTSTGADDTLVQVLSRTRAWFVLLASLFGGSHALEFAPRVERMLEILFTVGFAIQVGLWLSVALDAFFERYRRRNQTDTGVVTAITAMGFAARALLWSLLLLLALDNLGVDITAMVAGLGIGGIAVALAVQNILGDLFASVSIIVDRPFVVGDFIIVDDDYMGTVEHVGLKTTHVRSLGGEQIVFANNDLLKTRVRNYKRMYERRIVFTFGIDYATPPDDVQWVAEFLREQISKMENVRLERAHFFKFGESSLDYEVAYWVKSPDYGVYMDIQQNLNLRLMQALAARKIPFAYPTRTIKIETATPAPPSAGEPEVSPAPIKGPGPRLVRDH
ncbi:hypothetical protein B1810_16135 [Panacagrimonas perspica]|nr:hypothetical protein B1810_16135 [Panacagrimonas perspica]